MLTPEQRAIKNKENAQQSTGPATVEGKHRSSKNNLKHGRRAEALRNFVPPHGAVFCNQDRQLFFRLHEKLITNYKPYDPAEAIVVKKLAYAEWRSQTFDELFTAFWNKKLLEKCDGKPYPFPEFGEIYVELAVFVGLANSPAVDRLYQRVKKDLDRGITTYEKRLQFLRKNFPSATEVIERQEFDRERREFFRTYPERDEEQADPASASTFEATFSDTENEPESFQLVEQLRLSNPSNSQDPFFCTFFTFDAKSSETGPSRRPVQHIPIQR